MSIAGRAVVYDNSRPAGPLKVAELFCGLPIGALAWPEWAPESMRSRWDAAVRVTSQCSAGASSPNTAPPPHSAMKGDKSDYSQLP